MRTELLNLNLSDVQFDVLKLISKGEGEAAPRGILTGLQDLGLVFLSSLGANITPIGQNYLQAAAYTKGLAMQGYRLRAKARRRLASELSGSVAAFVDRLERDGVPRQMARVDAINVVRSILIKEQPGTPSEPLVRITSESFFGNGDESTT